MGNGTGFDPQLYFAGGALLFVLSLLMFLVLSVRISRLNKRYKKLLNGSSSADIEQVLIQIQEKMNDLGVETESNSRAIQEMRKEMKDRKSKVEMMRYNAFEQRGSEMSFSIAILNDYLDGVVLTGIHSREQTFMYAKPLEKGQSKYALSPEEQEIVERAAGHTEKQEKHVGAAR
jgi:hypothetical protein